mmetsp:Transcript_84117/g.256985  ORF Transcript_84117/g.256985 Transcript_84117/m.256985 type:complete len:274 (+) Transcript_84117:160-981(+)
MTWAGWKHLQEACVGMHQVWLLCRREPLKNDCTHSNSLLISKSGFPPTELRREVRSPSVKLTVRQRPNVKELPVRRSCHSLTGPSHACSDSESDNVYSSSINWLMAKSTLFLRNCFCRLLPRDAVNCSLPDSLRKPRWDLDNEVRSDSMPSTRVSCVVCVRTPGSATFDISCKPRSKLNSKVRFASMHAMRSSCVASARTSESAGSFITVPCAAPASRNASCNASSAFANSRSASAFLYVLSAHQLSIHLPSWSSPAFSCLARISSKCAAMAA